jgi:plastocyanin
MVGSSVALLLVACVPGQAGPAILPPIGPTITARDIAWVDAGLEMRVGQQQVTVDNQDAGVPHGLTIQNAHGDQLFIGEIVTGPAKTTYSIPPLAPGGYLFTCPVHPMMQGKLVVTG